MQERRIKRVILSLELAQIRLELEWRGVNRVTIGKGDSGLMVKFYAQAICPFSGYGDVALFC